MSIYGYFDSPEQTVPAFDPGDQVPCPACKKPVGRERVKSQSVLVPGDYRCYFFRYHADCADEPAITQAADDLVNGRFAVVDAIAEADGKPAETVEEWLTRHDAVRQQ